MLVTGASGGIGRAICLAFAEAGWFLGLHYHQNKTAAVDTLGQVTSAGAQGALYEADIRNSQEVRRMVEGFCRAAPQACALVCNAGIGGTELLIRHKEAAWADIITTNLTGTFHCLRAMAPAFMAREGGSIIVVGSYAAFHGTTGQAAYAASKAGLVGLVRTAAREWGSQNIRVNLVLPGWQRTALSENAFPAPASLEWNEHALHRPPALAEVARTVVHLALSKDVSGQVWNCDSRHL